MHGQRRQWRQRRAHLRRQWQRRLRRDARRRLVLRSTAAPAAGEETRELLEVALRLRRRQLPRPPLLVVLPPQRPLAPVRPLLRKRGRLRECLLRLDRGRRRAQRVFYENLGAVVGPVVLIALIAIILAMTLAVAMS